MIKEYEKCFVYQCLASVCHGSDIESRKFIVVCCDCPAFKNWLKEREKIRMNCGNMGS